MKLIFKLALVAVTAGSAYAAPMSDREKEDAFFKRYDLDRNNRLSRQEMPGFLRSKFNVFDYNGDGFVTKKELRRSAANKKRNKASSYNANKNSSKTQRAFNHYDRNRDGQIAPYEMSRKTKQMYRSYDVNGDGMLNFNEYSKLVSGDVKQSRKRSSTFTFNHFDRNRDGFIVQGEMSNKLKRKFRSFDQNGDGMLNRQEFRSLHAGRVIQPRKKKQYSRRGSRGSFYYLDLNRNGYITKDEMTNDLKNQFFSFDMNGDNKISRSEFRAAKREQHQQNGGYGYDSQQGGGMKQDYGERFEKKDAYDEILGNDKSGLY